MAEVPTFNPADTEPTNERVLSIEEVRDAMREMMGVDGKETRALSDERGLYLREVEVDGPKPGEMTEYAYRRVGDFMQFQTGVTTVEATYYEDGFPVGGKTVANLVDGQWKRQ